MRATQLAWQRKNADRIKARSAAGAPQKSAYDKLYRAANADRIREYQRRYRQENATDLRERDRQYRLENAERIRAVKKAYSAANAPRISERRKDSYPEQRDRVRAYRLANIEASRAIVARRKMRRAAIMDALDRLLSVEYRKAIASDPCAYCDAPGEQDDHKQPLARGGTDHWWNLHRACRACNYAKHTKTHDEFLAARQLA